MQKVEVEQIIIHQIHRLVFHKVVEEMQVMVRILVQMAVVKLEQLILAVVEVVVVMQIVEAQQQMVVLEVAE